MSLAIKPLRKKSPSDVDVFDLSGVLVADHVQRIEIGGQMSPRGPARFAWRGERHRRFAGIVGGPAGRHDCAAQTVIATARQYRSGVPHMARSDTRRALGNSTWRAN